MSVSQRREANQKQIQMTCPNPDCNYRWIYTGRLLHYATCPSCRRNVKIQDNKMETPQSVQVGSPSQIVAGTSEETDAS
jgi:hypothetical protein